MAKYSGGAFITALVDKQMKNNNCNQRHFAPTINCPDCDSSRVSTRLTPHKFKYGVGEDAPELSCVLPVRVCAECGAEFVDEEGEVVRHEAVCRHLALLTPRNVSCLRENVGTQVQFGELTGIGEASLSRWETGASLQSRAFDNFLFLLQFSDNIERLRRRRLDLQNESPEPSRPRFRSIDVTRRRLEQQRAFALRPAA